MEEQKMNQNETDENKAEEQESTPVQNNESTTEPAVEPVVENKTETSSSDATDVDANKAMAIVGYILPILFFIPLVTDAKNSTFAKFHANQQLNLLLFWVVGQIAGTVLTVVLIGLLILPLVMIAGLVFMIMGVINAVNGKMKKLPLIGGFEIIK